MFKIVQTNANEKPTEKPYMYIGRTSLHDYYIISFANYRYHEIEHWNNYYYHEDLTRFFEQFKDLKLNDKFEFIIENELGKKLKELDDA